MRRRRYAYEEPSRWRDFADFLEWQQTRDGSNIEKYEKAKLDANKPSPLKLTFTEGMLLAFMFQYFLGPTVHALLKVNGLQ